MKPDAVQAWLGTGYGVVAIAVLSGLIAPWLMELVKGRFSKSLETHKLNLKRAELLFEKEVVAAKAFLILNGSIKEIVTPGLDGEGAIEAIAASFPSISKDLSKFKLQHSFVLAIEMRELLNNTISTVNSYADEMAVQAQNSVPWEVEPSAEAIKYVDNLLANLRQIEMAMLSAIKGAG
jgi:hypothetical protein